MQCLSPLQRYENTRSNCSNQVPAACAAGWRKETVSSVHLSHTQRRELETLSEAKNRGRDIVFSYTEKLTPTCVADEVSNRGEKVNSGVEREERSDYHTVED